MTASPQQNEKSIVLFCGISCTFSPFEEPDQRYFTTRQGRQESYNIRIVFVFKERKYGKTKNVTSCGATTDNSPFSVTAYGSAVRAKAKVASGFLPENGSIPGSPSCLCRLSCGCCKYSCRRWKKFASTSKSSLESLVRSITIIS